MDFTINGESMKKVLAVGVFSLGLVGCMTPMTPTQQAMPEISQVIDVRLSGCNVLPEPNHHLPYLSLTVNYGDNIEEIKMFSKQ